MQIIDNIIDSSEIIRISPLRRKKTTHLENIIWEFEVFTRSRDFLISSPMYYVRFVDDPKQIRNNIEAHKWKLRYVEAYREICRLFHDDYPNYILNMEGDCRQVIEEMEQKLVQQNDK